MRGGSERRARDVVGRGSLALAGGIRVGPRRVARRQSARAPTCLVRRTGNAANPCARETTAGITTDGGHAVAPAPTVAAAAMANNDSNDNNDNNDEDDDTHTTRNNYDDEERATTKTTHGRRSRPSGSVLLSERSFSASCKCTPAPAPRRRGETEPPPPTSPQQNATTRQLASPDSPRDPHRRRAMRGPRTGEAVRSRRLGCKGEHAIRSRRRSFASSRFLSSSWRERDAVRRDAARRSTGRARSHTPG